jgi:hypothetical protein
VVSWGDSHVSHDSCRCLSAGVQLHDLQESFQRSPLFSCYWRVSAGGPYRLRQDVVRPAVARLLCGEVSSVLVGPVPSRDLPPECWKLRCVLGQSGHCRLG